jgi:hypothetical protein
MTTPEACQQNPNQTLLFHLFCALLAGYGALKIVEATHFGLVDVFFPLPVLLFGIMLVGTFFIFVARNSGDPASLVGTIARLVSLALLVLLISGLTQSYLAAIIFCFLGVLFAATFKKKRDAFGLDNT